MQRIQFGQAKEHVKLATGDCDDKRISELVNTAVRQLMDVKELWPGIAIVLELCIDDGCVTWPRFVRTPEIISTCNPCNSEITIRDAWYDMVDTGPGWLGKKSLYNVAMDRNPSPTFKNLCKGSILKVYTDESEASDATITFYGKDTFDRKVRSEVDGAWSDGETLNIGNGATPITTTQWAEGSLIGVKKSETNGRVIVTQIKPNGIEETIAIYEHDETDPWYKRTQVTGICTDKCRKIRAKVRLDWIELKRDSDYVLIPSLDAIEDMVKAIKMKRSENLSASQAYEANAYRKLRSVLGAELGYGREGTLQIKSGPSNYFNFNLR